MKRGPRLTIAELREIRRLCAERRRLLAAAKAIDRHALAVRFGIHEGHVRKIEARRAYRAVE